MGDGFKYDDTHNSVKVRNLKRHLVGKNGALRIFSTNGERKNIHKPKNKKTCKEKTYKEVLPELEKVLLKPKKVDDFINDRLEYLESRSNPTTIDGDAKIYKGYINSQSKIINTPLIPFKIDDKSIYSTLVECMLEIKEDRTLGQISLNAIQYALVKYFGAAGDKRVYSLYYEFYKDKQNEFSGTDKVISIKDFREKNFALCMERAAVAQNLFSFIGVESYLICSHKCIMAPGWDEGGHAYNIFKKEDEYYIYDPTNPVYTKEKKVTKYSPAIYQINEQQFKTILSGGIVKVDHEDYDFSQKIHVTEICRRVYGG